MHSKRVTPEIRRVGKKHGASRRWWLVRKFRKDSFLKLAEAATVEQIRQAKRVWGCGRIVEAK